MPEAIWSCPGDGVVDPSRRDPETKFVVENGLEWGRHLVGRKIVSCFWRSLVGPTPWLTYAHSPNVKEDNLGLPSADRHLVNEFSARNGQAAQHGTGVPLHLFAFQAYGCFAITICKRPCTVVAGKRVPAILPHPIHHRGLRASAHDEVGLVAR